jgi:hypothetical protein
MKTSKPKKISNPCKYKKLDCLHHNFECDWIVGKGCKPREGAEVPSPSTNAINFTALPPDIKEIIRSKLSPKSIAALKATNKEHNELLSIKFKSADYLEYGLKPYSKQLLKNLTKYEKTFRKDLRSEYHPPSTPEYLLPRGHQSVQKVLTSTAVNFDDAKFENLSTLMNKKSDSYKEKLNSAVKKGLRYCNERNYNPLPIKPDYDFDEIETEKELYEYITYQIARDYRKSYYNF